MTKGFTQQFGHLMNEIVTDAAVFPTFKDGELPPFSFFTHMAAWDTGSEHTIISSYVAESLGLESLGKEQFNGIGGQQEADTYRVAIALPNGYVYHDIKVASLPIDDYEVLIGMDIIQLVDFAITNQDDKTTFSFQTPSSTTIDFRKSQETKNPLPDVK